MDEAEITHVRRAGSQIKGSSGRVSPPPSPPFVQRGDSLSSCGNRADSNLAASGVGEIPAVIISVWAGDVFQGILYSLSECKFMVCFFSFSLSSSSSLTHFFSLIFFPFRYTKSKIFEALNQIQLISSNIVHRLAG